MHLDWTDEEWENFLLKGLIPPAKREKGSQMVEGKLLPIKSSAINGVQFNKTSAKAKTGTLRIYFTNGDVREYFPVPETVYNEFLEAQSHGYYFNTFIRDQFAQVPV